MTDKMLIEIFNRLQRIESRLVRGFTELGVVVQDSEDWCSVDTAKRTIIIRQSRALGAMVLAIKQAGGYSGDTYEIISAGQTVGTVVIGEKP